MKSVVSLFLLSVLFANPAVADLSVGQCANQIRQKIRNGLYRGYLRDFDGSRTCEVTVETTPERIVLSVTALDGNLQPLITRKIETQGGQGFLCTGNGKTPIIISRNLGPTGWVHEAQIFGNPSNAINLLSDKGAGTGPQRLELSCLIQYRIKE